MISDALYEHLLHAHRGLDARESAALNRALVLVLADRLDDDAAFLDAVRAARQAVVPDSDPRGGPEAGEDPPARGGGRRQA